ncbi:alpha/beta hydrolase [Streptomyces sp. NPDC057638]|uniref:alpha/beta hydrolase n=1 Tax=Streptomyces sp. NPDC057638 TaxID=3346190 RepID=UPI0036C0DE8D
MSSVPESPAAARPPSGARGGHARRRLRTQLRTADGVVLEAAYEPYTAGVSDAAIVVAHGFTGSLDRPAVRRAVAALSGHAAVVSFSFRGHGRSGGRSTVGDREVLDVAAAVAWARSLGHRTVVTVGFSMGGSVVLRHAALYGTGGGGSHAGAGAAPGVAGSGVRGRIGSTAGALSTGGAREARTDAVAAVSAPARWYYRGTPSMRRVHWVITRPLGRAVGRWGLGTRIHGRDWDPVPLPPVAAVPLIAPTPVLIVHGDRDPYFPLDHPRSLAAAGATELWLEPGMGHAENAVDERLLGRIAQWLIARAATVDGS